MSLEQKIKEKAQSSLKIHDEYEDLKRNLLFPEVRLEANIQWVSIDVVLRLVAEEQEEQRKQLQRLYDRLKSTFNANVGNSKKTRYGRDISEPRLLEIFDIIQKFEQFLDGEREKKP
jgi:hypothetical protein